MRMNARSLPLSLCGLALSASLAQAEALPMPEGPVVLTISGAISETNVEETAQFDIAMLKELEARDVETKTIWTEGSHVFTGISLSTLLEHVGAEEGTIRATAINDYTVEIPTSDGIEDGPIVAYEMDGNAMSRREKGPLWVLYPFDANAEYRTEVIYSRSIWQLDRMEIVEE